MTAPSSYIASSILPPIETVRTLNWSAAQAKQMGVYGFDSRDIRSRAFNLLRSRLLQMRKDVGARSFGIVSATPGVGKSFVATNLAASLSRAPTIQTYLLDLDLRRGSISRNFGYLPDNGIRDFLEERTDTLDAMSFRLAGEQLIVIPSDRGQVHSAELLAAPRMTALLHAITNMTTDAMFVCDLPPVFANDDAQIIAAQLDTYILVVETGRTTKKQIAESIDMLGRSRCAGVVLNRFNGGLLSNAYGYGYGGDKVYGDYFA